MPTENQTYPTTRYRPVLDGARPFLVRQLTYACAVAELQHDHRMHWARAAGHVRNAAWWTALLHGLASAAVARWPLAGVWVLLATGVLWLTFAQRAHRVAMHALKGDTEQ